MRHYTRRRPALLMALALLLLTFPQWAVAKFDEEEPPVDRRFGVIEAFWSPDEAAVLNVGFDRILFYWNEIQPTGPQDWNTLHVLEEWLTDARAHNRDVLGLLKNTPAWATDGQPYSGVPRGLYLPIDDPDNLWAGYVRKVVEYYAPLGVHHWVVWNEPEIDPGVYGHEFGGTTQDYYQLLKVAYQVAKQGDPEAVIHLAGWSYWHDPGWLDEFLRVASSDPEAAANNHFFDAITLHIYFRVETVEQLVDETWAIQARYGLRKPIWLNETNASPNLDPLWPVERPAFQVDLEQQAWFIVQAHALAFGAGTARVGVYKLLDVLLPPGGESFGILRPDHSRRPAFYAYETTVRYLSGFTYPVARQQAPDFYAFTFRRPEGVTRILWARRALAVTLDVPAMADSAQLVSATGMVETIQAENGVYRLTLGGARCTPDCDIGGPPLFLIEDLARPVAVQLIPTIDAAPLALATATQTATPDMTATTLATLATPTFTPTATGTPTATPTSTATPSPTETPQPTATIVPTATLRPTATPAAGRVGPDGSGFASWIFLGAAVVLAVTLGAALLRRRS